MKGVSGRVADFLVRKDGGLVAGVSLVERTLTAVTDIYQMQIVQEELDKIIIRLVKDHSYTQETQDFLIREFRAALGHDLKITFDYVNHIKPEESGKYRFAISKIPNPYM
jgi:phenylacetate-CoA ligase